MFAEQVDELIGRARMSSERLEAVPSVTRDLDLELGALWPGSRVVVFGSIVHGLATATSDVDCTVLLPHRSDTSPSLMAAAQSALQACPAFSRVRPLPAPVPVVTLTHSPTQFNVDLSINNFNCLQITNLFNYLLRTDKRVYKLAFIVKLWTKSQGLTSSRSLSNYAMVLMVVFYLQQLKLLPSIARLQANVDPFTPDNWNSSFNEIKYENNVNIPLKLLLSGFLEFYSSYDYDYIVSPFTGYPIEKRLFSNLNTVPNEFTLYRHNVLANISTPLSIEKGIIVQDVFFHNDNLAKHLDQNGFLKLKATFKDAAEKLRENSTVFLNLLDLNKV